MSEKRIDDLLKEVEEIERINEMRHEDDYMTEQNDILWKDDMYGEVYLQGIKA